MPTPELDLTIPQRTVQINADAKTVPSRRPDRAQFQQIGHAEIKTLAGDMMRPRKDNPLVRRLCPDRLPNELTVVDSMYPDLAEEVQLVRTKET